MVSHRDEVRVRDVEAGEVRGRWRRFGSPELGLRRLEVPPGARSMPVHVHVHAETERTSGLNICCYPRSGKVSLRGVQTVFRVQRVDYWDGEA
jgi:hypothetical protein